MLSYSQTVLVAASHEGEVLCLDCFKSWLSNETDVPEEDIDLGAMRVWLSTDSAREDGWYGIIEYVMSSEYNAEGLGVECFECGAQLAEPHCRECGSTRELVYCTEDGLDTGECYYYCPDHVPAAILPDVADLLAPDDIVDWTLVGEVEDITDEWFEVDDSDITDECDRCEDRNLCAYYAMTHGEE